MQWTIYSRKDRRSKERKYLNAGPYFGTINFTDRTRRGDGGSGGTTAVESEPVREFEDDIRGGTSLSGGETIIAKDGERVCTGRVDGPEGDAVGGKGGG
jgi:hypothetical protein